MAKAKAKSDPGEITLPANAPVFYDRPTYAAIVKKSVITCDRDRMRGRGPKWTKIGRRVLYPRDSVISYLESQTRGGKHSEGCLAGNHDGTVRPGAARQAASSADQRMKENETNESH